MNDKRDRVDMLKNLTFSDCVFLISDCCFYGVKTRESRTMLNKTHSNNNICSSQDS